MVQGSPWEFKGLEGFRVSGSLRGLGLRGFRVSAHEPSQAAGFDPQMAADADSTGRLG